MRNYIDEIKTLPLFTGIKHEDLEPMLTCLGSYLKTYKKGQFVSLAEEPLKCVGVLLSGKVHMIKEDLWGNKTILVLIKEGGVFGETFACGSDMVSTVTFVTASECKVLFMPFDRILHSCNLSCVFHHRLIENMVRLIADKNVQFLERLEVASKRTLREKILSFLSAQAEFHDNREFVISMGRLELADYLCVDRSALTRELSNMEDDGLIEYEKNRFKILQ
ncbi:MAG: Crp/Fnr family transcriptional regulator [Emergencia timonensis]|uniref:Crp/Fnr family transcriptional regulator n=1 Tax=Emergencia timonensis TaxID=1776384 RepID=UPI00082B82F6|nr:Crp/Fnr family transcriptional regulator [Emergencia timonensis]WNX87757.1 Crp/Fnr family transcriptional regulator [Emergencia timonensis]